MKLLPVSAGLLLLSCAVAQAAPGDHQDDESPSMELLEFIGEWALGNSQWQDPEELQKMPEPYDGKTSDEKPNP